MVSTKGDVWRGSPVTSGSRQCLSYRRAPWWRDHKTEQLRYLRDTRQAVPSIPARRKLRRPIRGHVASERRRPRRTRPAVTRPGQLFWTSASKSAPRSGADHETQRRVPFECRYISAGRRAARPTRSDVRRALIRNYQFTSPRAWRNFVTGLTERHAAPFLSLQTLTPDT